MFKFSKFGEDVAIDFLEKKGYRILARNYRSCFGEIDIVAKEKDTICFIEVKARRSEKFGLGKDAVDNLKKRHIAKTALKFLKEKNLLESKVRFDVVSISEEEDILHLELTKNAFEFED